MLLTYLFRSLTILSTLFLFQSCEVYAQYHPDEPAQYQRLPPLREQAAILESWRQERIDALPALMQEHGVDVWLVRFLGQYVSL